MPRLGWARLLRVLGSTVVVLLGLALVWPLASPSYNRVVTAVARPLVPGPVIVEVDKQGPNHIEMASPELTSRRLKVQGFTFQGGTVLFLTLVLATPGMAILRRLAWAIAALGLFLLLHAGLLSLIGWSFLWSVQVPRLGLKEFEPAWVGLGLLVPAVLGAVWCWAHWLPAPARTSAPTEHPRERLRASRT